MPQVAVELRPLGGCEVAGGGGVLVGVETDHLAAAGEDRAGGAEHDPAVGGGEDVIGLEVRGLVARPRPHGAAVEVLHHRAGQDRVDGLELGQVDDLALARPLGVDVAGQRRPQGEQRRDVVAGVGGGPHRRVGIGEAGLEHEAAESLADHVVRRPAEVAGVAGLAVARHVGDHQRGVGGQHDVVGQPPLLERAGLGALHPDVPALHQAQEQLPPVGGAQVERDVEGIAPLLDEGARHRVAVVAADGEVEQAPGVAGAARVLDLDHLGPEGAGQVSGEGLGDERAGGEDPHPLQRPEGFGYETADGCVHTAKATGRTPRSSVAPTTPVVSCRRHWTGGR